MSVVYWRARAEQAEQKLKLCLRGIGLIGASAGLYNDANCPIPMVEIVTRVVDEIARLTRERDEARAESEHMRRQRESNRALLRQATTWSHCPYCGAYPRGVHAPGCHGPDVMRAADKALATKASE